MIHRLTFPANCAILLTSSVHRVVYEMLVGPIPPGMCVCHHCDNPICVRPVHMFTGTQGDNVIDCLTKGRHVTPRLHGESGSAAKLTAEDVACIKSTFKQGETSPTRVARAYHVSDTTIRDLTKGRTWRYPSAQPSVHTPALAAWRSASASDGKAKCGTGGGE